MGHNCVLRKKIKSATCKLYSLKHHTPEMIFQLKGLYFCVIPFIISVSTLTPWCGLDYTPTNIILLYIHRSHFRAIGSHWSISIVVTTAQRPSVRAGEMGFESCDPTRCLAQGLNPKTLPIESNSPPTEPVLKHAHAQSNSGENARHCSPD